MSLNLRFTDTSRKTSEVLEDIIARMSATDRITLRELFAMMGEQGLLLLCALLSLPFLFPVSIPGVSTVFGVGIVLIAVAIMLNRLPWLPNFIADRQIDTARLTPVLERGIRVLKKIDRFLKQRLPVLTDGVFVNRINGLALAFAGVLLMMPLSFIPFSNTLPGIAILLFATGISQRDGALVLGGYIMNVVTVVYFAGLAWLAWQAGTSLTGG